MKLDIKFNLVNFIASFIFAVFAVLSNTFDSDAKYVASMDEIICNTDVLSNVFVFLLAFVLFYGVLHILSKFTVKKTEYTRKQQVIITMFVFLIINCVYLLYSLVHYPGTILPDSLSSLSIIFEGGDVGLSNHHPLIYTSFINLCLKVGNFLGMDTNGGVFIYTICQQLVISSIITYSIYWLTKVKCNFVFIIVLTCIYAFFPHFALFANVMWKDPMFGAFILLLVVKLADIFVFRRFNSLIDSLSIGAICFLICLLRNNGIYIVIALLIYLILGIKKYKYIVVSIAVVVGSYFVLTGPIYDYYDVEKPSVEALAIPIQQIGYSYQINPSSFSEKDVEVLSNILPISDWQSSYTPRMVDNLKWHSNWNTEYFESNLDDFISIYLKNLPGNFVNYVKAYLAETEGFWTLLGQKNHEYYSRAVYDNDYGIYTRNIVLEKANINLSTILDKDVLVGAGTLFWISYLAFFICLKKKYDYFNPSFYVVFISWLTVMVASPIAFAMRYVTGLVYCTPFLIVLPFIHNDPKPFVDEKEYEMKKYERNKIVVGFLSLLLLPLLAYISLILLVNSRTIVISQNYSDEQKVTYLNDDYFYKQTIVIENPITLSKINILTTETLSQDFDLYYSLTFEDTILVEKSISSATFGNNSDDLWLSLSMNNMHLEPGKYILSIHGNSNDQLTGLIFGNQYGEHYIPSVVINDVDSGQYLNVKLYGYIK